MMLVRACVEPSAIHGMGLFAAEFVPAGKPVWRFEPGFDHDFSPEQFAALPPLAREHTRWFCFVSRETGHVILSGDHACFINHSTKPNTGAPRPCSPPVTTVALRDISVGEEITCDYYDYDADTPWKLGLVGRDTPLPVAFPGAAGVSSARARGNGIMEKAKAPGFDVVGDALRRGASSPPAWVEVDGQRVPLVYRRNPAAKRYRLFVDRDGRARVTIPRRGTQYEAREFVAQHQDWLLNQLRRFAQRQGAESVWGAGTEVLFRGLKISLDVSHGDGHGPSFVRVGNDRVPVNLPAGPKPGQNGVREAVERHWRQLAEVELPHRTEELAARHGCVVRGVHVRSQRTRWGSCSRRGVVSLNWRLVQVPETVRDYIILHELMHLREMNHSRRFWAEVERACPGFRECEAWLKAHSRALL